ncbi:hypothetical protein K0M31_007856 [Melipona bicolor]|uniref:Uncharacterized protein n=1 Tax=Melipona bicolor TaxID=60889 RepID=A0AA40GCG6_9HYME|nr:hypothetical protein K0M31_007856 [Melipona bicolor]
MTERLKPNPLKIQSPKSASRSGKDAASPHRGCINFSILLERSKIYYRNDPVKYDLGFCRHDDAYIYLAKYLSTAGTGFNCLAICEENPEITTMRTLEDRLMFKATRRKVLDYPLKSFSVIITPNRADQFDRS